MGNTERSEAATVHRLISAHVRRANTLRQIQSNKASRAKRGNTWYLMATIVVATIVSVVGFGGVDQFASVLSDAVNPIVISLIYSMVVLLILIITLVGLILRFDERASRHYRSIEILTEFIRDWEDRLALATTSGNALSVSDLTFARLSYKGIIMGLPPNSDKEYARAKKNAESKNQAPKTQSDPSTAIEPAGVYEGDWELLSAKSVLGGTSWEEKLGLLMSRDAYRRKILQVVETELGSNAWVTGGFVRDAVWDNLHRHRFATVIEDIDIIYYDTTDLAEASEVKLTSSLVSKYPNVKWSVKNQARMHLVAHDKPYMSLEDAISRFPETATAVAVQLNKGALRIVAPLGLQDLFQLSLRANPRANKASYDRRLIEKKWLQRWPLLSVE